MAMSDPFSTTAELAYRGGSSLGEGILQASGIYAQKKQQLQQMKMMRNQGQQLLQQFGIVGPDGQIDVNKARNAGVEISSDGTVTVKPIQKQINLLQQLEERQALEGYKKLHPEDKSAQELVYKGGKTGGTISEPSGFGAAAIKFGKEEAPAIYEAVKRGEMSGYQNATPQVKTVVANLAAKEGYNLDQPSLGFSAKKSVMGNIKIVDQKVQNAISAQVLLDASFDPKSGNYKVSPSQHAELAIATARMLSPTGVVSDDRVAELRQGTARENASKLAIWFGLDPAEIGGSTQSVVNMFAKLIKREGAAAQQIRQNYSSGQTSNLEDFTSTKQDLSSMSDDELRKIAGVK